VPLKESDISKGFKDISLSFSRHPITNDISAIYNEDAIKKSVMNLVRTKLGERFFNPFIGSNVEAMLFELSTLGLDDAITEEIRTTIINFEPRVVLRDISVNDNFDNNELFIEVVYDIVGLPTPTQTLSFVLQPTRY
jgi:phage baseplate assembly protein W